MKTIRFEGATRAEADQKANEWKNAHLGAQILVEVAMEPGPSAGYHAPKIERKNISISVTISYEDAD
jgi:hypothetical protein